MTSIFDFPSRRAWIALALAGAAAYGTLAALDFSIRILPIMCFAAAVALFTAGGYVYLRLRPDAHLFAIFMGLAYFVAMCLTAGVLAFAVVPLAGPLWDDRFMAFEERIGIDWPALATFLAGNPTMNNIWALAYLSPVTQILSVLILLPSFGHSERLAAFLKLMNATLIACVVISLVIPAVGPVEAYRMPDAARQQLGASAYGYVEQLLALREGRLTSFDFGHMQGMVTFPSYHTIMAILTAWALWPLRFVGPLAVVFNGVVIVSTIPWGGHYVSDVVGGAAIAVLGIAFVSPRRSAAPLPIPAMALPAE
ncbi:PAP2 superfamily protein [Rhizobiales bacterium GAS188]|nr:PAP2 superfamily protein [Rhizobiales bacterium GAS188]